jgi:hypothetical protein
MIVVSSGFRGWKDTLDLRKLLLELNFELENFLWIDALNCYNALGLYMEVLLFDYLVEHVKMDVMLLVINEVQVVCCAILKHLGK